MIISTVPDKKRKNIVLLIFLIMLISGLFFLWFRTQSMNMASKVPPRKTYMSKKVKISFTYPHNWFVTEKNGDILVTSYKSTLGENSIPADGAVKIMINNFVICGQTLEEELIKHPCIPVGGVANEILRTEERIVSSGTLSSFKIRYPSGDVLQSSYLTQKQGKRILRIVSQGTMQNEAYTILSTIKFL